jgi:putative nucleotidyltransferase with HDIG domain
VTEVARGEVRQREKLGARLSSDERGLPRGRMQRLACTVALAGQKGRLVYEHVGAGCCLDDGSRGGGVSREDQLAPVSGRSEHVVRRHHSSVGERYALAALEEPASGTVGDTEAVCGVDIEAARPHSFDERVTHRGHAVLHRKRLQSVPVPLEDGPRLELDGLQRVREPPEDAAKGGQELAQSSRAVDRERELPASEGERLEHARQPEIVIRVVVSDEDLLELDQADVAPQKLALSALGAVEQQAIAATPDEGRGEGASGSRCGSGRPEKDHVEIHAGGVYALKSPLTTADTSGMASRAYRSAGLLRSLALLWTFVVASGVILAVSAFVLSSVLTENFRDQILADSSRDVALYADSVLAPALVRGDRIVPNARARRRVARAVASADELLKVAVWSRRARHVFTTPAGGRTVRSSDVLRTLRTGQAQATVTEIAVGRRGKERPTRAVVAWAPLLSRSGRRVGVAQVFLAPTALDTSVASATRTIWIVVGIVFAILWLALVLLVRGAAARLSRQNEVLIGSRRDLSESSQRLEQSLLETIETLNAAVEARDPYTAGHSQRVRRVALAIGRELSLSVKQLGTLGTSALFHDVGKIGIPDSILTKAGPLEPGEAAIMREHVTRGAEIVSKVSSFQEAVPAIRHHHERWDGLGYPDGLHGDDIPLEAAIIGLADAWDAMTTDRPYAHGLTLNQAMLQLRSGREKQFSPVVVDAFWRVAKRHPSDILPPEAPSASVAAI